MIYVPADEKIRANNDGLGRRVIVRDDPDS